MRQDHLPLTVASSDPLAAHMDEVQYGEDQGPCLQTLRTGQVTVVEDLAHEDRWGSYVAPRPRVRRTQLTVPPVGRQRAQPRRHEHLRPPTRAFGAEERQHAEIFATQASAALTVVTRQAQQTQLTDQLREALAARAVIDQALGIVMAQQHCDHDAAFTILRSSSQHQNRKLRDVAAEIVEAITGRPPGTTRFNKPT